MPSSFDILPYQVIDHLFTQIVRTQGRFETIRFILLFKYERTPTGNYVRALLLRNFEWRTDNPPPNPVSVSHRYRNLIENRIPNDGDIEQYATLQISNTRYFWHNADTFRFWTRELEEHDLDRYILGRPSFQLR